MGLKEQTVNMFSGVRALIFLFSAAIAFIAVHKLYKAINALTMSPMASTTLAIAFWLVSFTVVYMGTLWAYQGRGRQDGSGN